MLVVNECGHYFFQDGYYMCKISSKRGGMLYVLHNCIDLQFEEHVGLMMLMVKGLMAKKKSIFSIN